MIRTATGMDVDRLMHSVLSRPACYAQVVVCVPFVDDEMLDLIIRLADATRRAGCGLRVITTPATAAVVHRRLPGHPEQWRSLVVARKSLHAKVYLVVGRSPARSEALVTSANLTAAGVARNIELGVLACPSTDSGRQLINEVRRFLQDLVGVHPRSSARQR